MGDGVLLDDKEVVALAATQSSHAVTFFFFKNTSAGAR